MSNSSILATSLASYQALSGGHTLRACVIFPVKAGNSYIVGYFPYCFSIYYIFMSLIDSIAEPAIFDPAVCEGPEQRQDG